VIAPTSRLLMDRRDGGAIINTGTMIGRFAIINTGAIVDHEQLVEDKSDCTGRNLAGRVICRRDCFIERVQPLFQTWSSARALCRGGSYGLRAVKPYTLSPAVRQRRKKALKEVCIIAPLTTGLVSKREVMAYFLERLFLRCRTAGDQVDDDRSYDRRLPRDIGALADDHVWNNGCTRSDEANRVGR